MVQVLVHSSRCLARKISTVTPVRRPTSTCVTIPTIASEQWTTERATCPSIVRSRTRLCSMIPRQFYGGPSFRNHTTSSTESGGDDDDKSKAAHALARVQLAQETNDASTSSTRTSPQLSQGDSPQAPAGCLWKSGDEKNEDGTSNAKHNDFIPQVSLHATDGRRTKRVLILCTGGTLTMAPDATGALAPVQGALSKYMSQMNELEISSSNTESDIPEYVLHEYTPFLDSSDLGPADWARLARDIQSNYWHFDGFVVITGTDTMAYCATALSFMLENLGKPVVFTGSQIPLCQPYNDARRNLILAMVFASRETTVPEVTIFFHDRLLRACRSTKVHTHRLGAFDSPNQDPLAKIGIGIHENEHLRRPLPRGALRVHTAMDTRLLTIRLVPGFDDAVLRHMLEPSLLSSGTNSKESFTDQSSSPQSPPPPLRALILQLYGTGNIPSLKESFIQLLADAAQYGVLVVAATQCHTGSVQMGHYAVGRALQTAGVVSSHDMTLEAVACKIAYLHGRQDLTDTQVAALLAVSLRGEVTPPEAAERLSLEDTVYQQGMRQGKAWF